MAATYDRRVSDDFLALFVNDHDPGVMGSLTELARRAMYPVDLQFRRGRSGRQHATLYVGLTSVLDVHRSKAGLISLDVHASHRKSGGFDPAWIEKRSLEDLARIWPEVELYLDRIIPAATRSHGTKEGAVQAAVSSSRSSDLVVVDREVTPSFPDKAEKAAFMSTCQAPILAALTEAGLGFGGQPTKLGNECDALAVRADGTVLAIEVKPIGAGTIAWVAAQAAMYARILQRWIDEPTSREVPDPADVLNGLVAQRHRVGLGSSEPTVTLPLKVVPVVALQRGASAEMVRQMLAVAEVLDAAELGLPPVEIYEVNLLGELQPLDQSRLADGRPRARSYAAAENQRQVAWKQSAPDDVLPPAAREPGSVKDRAHQPVQVEYALPTEHASYNLLPEVRSLALDMFADLGIPWHQGADRRPSAHLRSSQVQCVNALGQMVADPERIVRAFGPALGIAEIRDFGEVDPTEAGRHLTFEFIGGKDYLGESRNGQRTRGSQCTSVDAAFAYTATDGSRCLALVEWKYMETYPSADRAAGAKLATRLQRYEHLLRAPNSPVDIDGVDLGDLFHEPLYQLVRQQLLASALEEDPEVAADVVRVVHVLSPDNVAYLRSHVAPALRSRGSTVKDVWQSLLRRPDRFVELDPAVFLDPGVTSPGYVARYGAAGDE